VDAEVKVKVKVNGGIGASYEVFVYMYTSPLVLAPSYPMALRLYLQQEAQRKGSAFIRMDPPGMAPA
jgi:hypothetical protein